MFIWIIQIIFTLYSLVEVACAEQSNKASRWKLTWIQWPFSIDNKVLYLQINSYTTIFWSEINLENIFFYWNSSMLIFTQGRRAPANIRQVNFLFVWLPRETNAGKGCLACIFVMLTTLEDYLICELNWRHFITISPLEETHNPPHQILLLMRSLTFPKTEEINLIN